MPQVKLEKCSKQKYWVGTVCLVEELFYYKYPFCLPDFFQQNKSFLKYDKSKLRELKGYLSLLEDDIYWISRKSYLQIIEFFINKMITIDEFVEQFSELRGENMRFYNLRKKNLKNETNLQLNSKSTGFAKIIGSIYSTLDLVNSDIDLNMNLEHPELVGYGMSEEFFRLYLKHYFLPQILRYCKEF